MTEQEFIRGYEEEINYQKHMIENLGRWFTLLLMIASSGVVLIYFFQQHHLPFFILGVVLAVIGFLGMLLFGYGIYRGRQNVNKVINDFDLKLKAFQK